MNADAELFTIKTALVQAYLIDNGYDGILLNKANNFAMATGGKRNYVYTYGDLGASGLFITKDRDVFFVGSTIEEPRIMAEELAGLPCDAKSYLWFEETNAQRIAREFSGNLVSDDGSLGKNVDADLARLRALLTEAELEKYRRLGALAAEAMTAVCQAVRPGMLETDIAALIVAEGQKRRCQVPIALVAADERIEQFRHPLPTQASLLGDGLEERGVRRYVEVIGGFMREGLVVSITRFAAVEALPASLLERYDRICIVDAIMQVNTRPGRTLGDVLEICKVSYKTVDFSEKEWHNHHQGGIAGYAGRACKAVPGSEFPVLDAYWPDRVRAMLGEAIRFGAAFAWNPSAPGVKSEDTFILDSSGRQEIITQTPAFPKVEIQGLVPGFSGFSKSSIYVQ